MKKTTPPPPARVCSGCRFWHQHEPDHVDGECCAIGDHRYRNTKQASAYVSGPLGCFWTKANFGCVLWVERRPGQQGGDMPDDLMKLRGLKRA